MYRTPAGSGEEVGSFLVFREREVTGWPGSIFRAGRERVSPRTPTGARSVNALRRAVQVYRDARTLDVAWVARP